MGERELMRDLHLEQTVMIGGCRDNDDDAPHTREEVATAPPLLVRVKNPV